MTIRPNGFILITGIPYLLYVAYLLAFVDMPPFSFLWRLTFGLGVLIIVLLQFRDRTSTAE